ncbi:MAG TPA: AAC(3) family N-acetyltransferase [Rugosimonospora sp.]|nr:AAC(3) family N-acetyltransferase [Rugosimonospora sp.]
MAAGRPQTRESLGRDLARLGLRAGEVVLVHSSLRALGWVCGGAVAVVQALLDVLGPGGTLVVPAQATRNRDPSRWSDPAVPAEWWPAIREHLPGFDPAVTPCRAMGLVAETVRTWPGAVRSPHPQTSFAAVGHRAAALMARHDLDCELGEASPLGALEAAGALILLLGVGFDRCTAFHLAEYRQPGLRHRENACVVLTPAGRQWVTYRGAELDASDFAELGADFARRTPHVVTGPVGEAPAHLLPLPEAVSFATMWLPSARAA